jgi:hypothetical protein
MVGDERLAKGPVFPHGLNGSARTCGFGTQREFSQAPAPQGTWPPDPESENPATAGTGAGLSNDHVGQIEPAQHTTTGEFSPQDLKDFGRIKAKVCVTKGGCWEWQAHKSLDGYGRVYFKGRQWQAHRATYELAREKIATGMVLHHLCFNRACCNPLHLEQVTPQENTRRNLSPPSCNARKTRCDNGHPFDSANTYFRKGRRSCRACNAEAVRRYKARKAGGSK